MNNLFVLAANEASSGSVFYLNSIFGTIGNVLGGTGPGLLGEMFKVFNTTVLALGSLIVSYTTVMSILLTAHEGEALGKEFHGIWIPLRTVMGIAALVPTSTGYSYLQIGLMWFIIQGIGAADTLWTSTLNYVAAGKSTASNGPGSVANLGLQQHLASLFESLACQAAEKASYTTGYFCADNKSDPFCKRADVDMLSVTSGSPQVKSNVYQMGHGTNTGDCGSLTLGDTTTSIGQAQNQAFQQIIPTFGSLAAQLVAIDYAYSSFVNAPVLAPVAAPSWLTQYCTDNSLSGPQCNAAAFSSYPPPTQSNSNDNTVKDLYWNYGLKTTAGGNFLATAATLYTGIVGAAAPTSGGNNDLASVKNTAIDNGWIFAGGYFYYIAKANNKSATKVAVFSAPTSPSMPLSSPPAASMLSAATTIANSLTNSAPTSNTSSIHMGSGGAGGGAGALGSAIINSWIGTLSGSSGAGLSENPVIAAQSEGDDILLAVELVVPILMALSLASGLAGGIFPLGIGPLTTFAIVMEIFFTPIAMFFILIFMGLGLTLAVYTPMIPYMLFTFGALNWLIATIETMIAAPLVAIGLLHPEGGHNIWGKAEKALMLMLNIFLRPSLMIFGMISGMLMSSTVVMMINYAFLNVVQMVSPDSNVLEFVFFMVLYTSIFTTSINKCFALIHLIPDQVLRWIGGEAQFGEGGGLDKVEQGFQGASQKAGQAAEGGVKGAKAAGKAFKKAKGKPKGGGGGLGGAT